MAIIESNYVLEQTLDFNPYALDLESPVVTRLTHELVSNRMPYIDVTTNPDIADDSANYAIYKIYGNEGYAHISRAVEGSVMQQEWEEDPAVLQLKSAALENNSIFFLVMDLSDPNKPKPAASLSIADCNQGTCETMMAFAHMYGSDHEVPKELTVSTQDETEGLWDVMAIMVPRDYRGTKVSAWAYHALYRAAQDHGIKRMIATITDKEFSNLSKLGIPFDQIEGTQKLVMARKNGNPINFGFYTMQVDKIGDSIREKVQEIEARETHRQHNQVFANLARIAVEGAYQES